jgi:GntR family transcriptional regulator
MTGIDRQHPLPIYFQLKELLRVKIVAGVWKSGDLLPSERELSESYDISRMTARQALNELVNEGLVYRKQGRGTFVAEPKLVQRLSHLTGYTDDMRERALRPGSRVLRLEMVDASLHVAAMLRIEAGAQVVLLERLRLADEAPMAVEASHLHFDGMEGLLQEDFARDSLYNVLTTKYNIIPTRAEQQIEAARCDKHRRNDLQLEMGAPVLHTTRVTFDQRDRPFEYADSVYRGDRYIFHVELT